MSPLKDPIRHPNTGNPKRTPAKTQRDRFLDTDVTEDEHRAIVDYCIGKKVSVSEFLYDLILEDAAQSKDRNEPVLLKTSLKLTADQFDKLRLLAHLHQKESVEELIQEFIQPYLDLQRFHAPAQTKLLRFYLSEKEHERTVKHLASLGLPARKYVSFLAMKKIAKERKR